MSNDWLIYGATGYTGQLILEEASQRGLKLIISGRDETKLAQLSQQYGFDYVCFDLSSRQRIAEILSQVKVLLNCAGPFSKTAAPLISACLHSNTHYLDITGEIDVFEHAKLLDKSAKAAGILLCPGVGFDVVPTDCLAKGVKERLPNTDSLWLGFSSSSRMSPGTAKTAVEGIAAGGKILRDGRLTKTPLAYKVRNIDFGDGVKKASTIPWGDVSTAGFGTDIPNIEVYVPMSEKQIKTFRRLDKLRWIFRYQGLIKWLQRRIQKKIIGPDMTQRERHQTFVWAEGVNRQGDSVTARIITANGYDVTKHAAIEISQYLLNHSVTPGFTTPACLMGSDFVERLPGSGKINWQETRSNLADPLE